MAEEKNNLPSHLRNVPPDKITKQQIIALFNTEIIRWNYNKMLQGLQDMDITKDNLQESYPEFKEGDRFIKKITEWSKDEARPFSDVCDLFLEVRKEIIEPISEILALRKSQVKTASEANAAEIAQAKKEQERIDLITTTMGQFINKITADITIATTDAQIVLIQKLIGSEKSKKNFYAEFWDELMAKCDALTPTINQQKEKIRDLKKLNEQLSQAIKSDDNKKASELKEKIDDTNAILVENSIRLQEKAFEQSLNITQTEVGQPELNVVKGKSNRWRWRVDNIEFLHKKFPQFTKVVTNDEEIEKFMKNQRQLGLFKTEETEITVNGIIFYKEKYL